MTSNETGSPGLAVERGAGVTVWRQIEQIDVDEGGVPIKYGITHFAADRVQLLVEDGV
jgi:hypothetical protein